MATRTLSRPRRRVKQRSEPTTSPIGTKPPKTKTKQKRKRRVQRRRNTRRGPGSAWLNKIARCSEPESRRRRRDRRARLEAWAEQDPDVLRCRAERHRHRSDGRPDPEIEAIIAEVRAQVAAEGDCWSFNTPA